MVHAARGTRETDAGTIPVEDPDERALLGAQARGVWIRTLVLTAAATALALVV